MSKTATVRARMEPRLKTRAENIFEKLGLSTTEAITLFYQKVASDRGIPFSLKVPNEETQKVFRDTDKGIGIVKAKSANDMFDDLGL